MNIYDFDNTIYKGDSTRDFYFYCVKHYPKMLLSVPSMAGAFFMYILKVKTKTQFKEKMYGFLKYIPDIDLAVRDFWETHEKNIKAWYRRDQLEDDIIISASPEFLLSVICGKIGINHLIASVVDKKTGKYTGENCHGEEKVKRLYKEFPDAVCGEFYSDSLSDAPLARIAGKAWIVQGDKLIKWENC